MMPGSLGQGLQQGHSVLSSPSCGAVGRPDVADLSLALVRECAAVGYAEGANLSADIAEKQSP